MKIAVAGGTGVVGRYTVTAAEAAGHEVAVLSRSRGVDVTDEHLLAGALDGVDVVIDTLNLVAARGGASETFFTATSRLVSQVGASVGVRHLVTLSIVGIDRASGYGYYKAKLAQEKEVASGPLPWTILRATQFHEFPAQMLAVARKGPFALMARMRSQPVAARTVGVHLVQAAESQPGGVLELAGPEVHEMPDLARRFLVSRGLGGWVIPVPIPGSAGRAMRQGALLATQNTTIDGPSFDGWLGSEDARRLPI